MKRWTTTVLAWAAAVAMLVIVARLMLPLMGLAGVEGEIVQPLVRLMPAAILIFAGSVLGIVFDLRRQARAADAHAIGGARWKDNFVANAKRQPALQKFAGRNAQAQRSNYSEIALESSVVGPVALVGTFAAGGPDEVDEVDEVVMGVEAFEPQRLSMPVFESAFEPAFELANAARRESQPVLSPPAFSTADLSGLTMEVDLPATDLRLSNGKIVAPQPTRVTAAIKTAFPDDCQQAAGEEQLGRDARTLSGSINARYQHLIHQLNSPAAFCQLPPPVPEFAGRTFELETLLAASVGNEFRALGLQGPGGIGKTTLALQLANQIAADYPDGQFYLDLKGFSAQPLSLAEAQSQIVRAYLPTVCLPESEAELDHLYQALLADKRALLLFDNVVNGSQLSSLIAPTGCLSIVTSRQTIALPQVFTQQLDGLPASEARELLQRLAPRAGQDADRIAALCGNLPLALRLAASALTLNPDLEIESYARQLEQLHARRLQPGVRGNPIEAALEVSYKMLPAGLQAMWRMLAVFTDTFDANAATALWRLSPARAAAAIDRLAACSLVERNRLTGRYRLHDLMTAFAETRLAAAERDSARQLHSAHYQSVLHEADALYEQGGEMLRVGLNLVDQEWHNIQAGQTWAAAQRDHNRAACELCSSYPDAGKYVLDLRQHPRERIRWSEIALASALKLKRRKAAARHLIELGDSYADLSETHHAIGLYKQALGLARAAKDRRGEAGAINGLGVAHYLNGELSQARELLEQAMDLFAGLGDTRGQARSLTNLGLVYHAMGEIRSAELQFDQALKAAREIGDRRSESIALGGLGLAVIALRASGDEKRAAAMFTQQLDIARDLGDRRGEASALTNLGQAYTGLGYHPQAIAFHEQSLTIAREIGDRRSEATALGGFGLTELVALHTQHAIELFEAQLKLTREIGDRRGEATALTNLGAACVTFNQNERI